MANHFVLNTWNGEHCLNINICYNKSKTFRHIFSTFVCVSGGGLLSGGLFAQGVNVRGAIVRGAIVRGVNVQVVNVRGVIVRGVNVRPPPGGLFERGAYFAKLLLPLGA